MKLTGYWHGEVPMLIIAYAKVSYRGGQLGVSK